jgi:hypothetical protein
LKIIEQVLEFNRNSTGDNSETLRKLEKCRIEEKLNDLIFSKMNDKISYLSKQMLEEYFDKIINNNFNI